MLKYNNGKEKTKRKTKQIYLKLNFPKYNT